MISEVQDVITDHGDMLHDAQLDYCGHRLATCSSDSTVKIFDVRSDPDKLLATLDGHSGPVWQVAWGYPQFGSILASCSYDKKIIVWQENEGKWEEHYVYNGHDSSVNSISWAPSELGLILACGSSDGSISVLTGNEDGCWESTKIRNAHTIGCNAVSWAPISAQSAFSVDKSPYALLHPPPKLAKRFVSGGCDNLVKIWKHVNEDQDPKWCEERKLEAHSNWVRDVAWAPSLKHGQTVIASCSQDKRVIIWTKDLDKDWGVQVLALFDDVVWHVSWSLNGSILAVSGGNNKVSLWKMVDEDRWALLHDDDDEQE